MIDEVAEHVRAFVQYEAVQNGVVAVHMRLKHRCVIPPTLLTLRFGAEVAPIGVGADALVGEQILNDWFVIEARSEAEQRAAKVNQWAAVEKVAARARGETGAVGDEELEHRQVFVHDREVRGHLAKVRLAQVRGIESPHLVRVRVRGLEG